MSWSTRTLLCVGLCAAALPAAAEPLSYSIQRAGVVRVLVDADVAVTWVPPLGLGLRALGPEGEALLQLAQPLEQLGAV